MGAPRRGKRWALLGGAASLAVVLAAAWLFRDDVLWWWRMRGVVEVRVIDYTLGKHVIKGPAAVAQAARATRRFIESLAEQKPSDTHVVGYRYLSKVAFLRSGEPSLVSVQVNHFEDEHPVIYCLGAYYDCTLSAWRGYLGEVLSATTPDLLAAWRDPNGDQERRFQLAASLALAAPDTEGLVDYFTQAVEENPRALLFLGILGPRAAGAAPIVEAVANDLKIDIEIRRAAREALSKVRGEAR